MSHQGQHICCLVLDYPGEILAVLLANPSGLKPQTLCGCEDQEFCYVHPWYGPYKHLWSIYLVESIVGDDIWPPI